VLLQDGARLLDALRLHAGVLLVGWLLVAGTV
jgi:hypothetical protein